MNATLGSTLNSPLESPDVYQHFLPVSEIAAAATTSMASIKLSADSINSKSQQVRLQTFTKQQTITSSLSGINKNGTNSNNTTTTTTTTASFIETNSSSQSSLASARNTNCDPKLNTIFEYKIQSKLPKIPPTPILTCRNPNNNIRTTIKDGHAFCLSSVGRSFIDDSDDNTIASTTHVQKYDSINTPDTPEPNISPSSSSVASKSCFSETFSNDFMKPSTPSVIVSPLDEQGPKYASSTTTNNTNGGSWDLIELDLDFHHVNLDPHFGGAVQEHVFFGDDHPFCIPLPSKPTEPDSHDL